MLTFKLDGNILEVTQTINGFTNSKVTYWYYDIELWIKSSTGKKDSKPDRLMSDAEIEWVTINYLPKVRT